MPWGVLTGCMRIPIGVLSLLLFCVAAAIAGDNDCDLLNSSSFRKSADTALEKRQYGLAAQEFQKALDACPEQRVILLDLSQAQAHNRDFPQALHAAQRFLELEPNSITGR